ncbi:MAG: PAS domain S-box protein [Leptolinea sp.]|nr:PAS domain S-box protein [Leptolinea sp.]
MIYESFLILVQNISLLLASVLIVDILSQNWLGGRNVYQNVAIGLIVGLIGISIMLTPWVFIPGVIFDTRSVLLGISGLFFGSIPTVIAMLMTLILRIYQGGYGTIMGVSVIIATGSLGILWRKISRKSLENISGVELYLFGLLIHVVMLMLTLTLPNEIAKITFNAIYVPILTIYPLGTVILGKIIITRLQREKMGEKIAEKEAHYRIVAENTYDWEYWLNPEGAFEYCSPSVSQITGYTWQEMLSDPDLISKMVHPEDRGFFQEYHDIQLKNEGHSTESDVDFRVIRPDGEIRWINHICRRIYDENGKYLGLRGSNRDITEKRRAEEDLQLNEEKYRSYTEKISDVIWVLDPETQFFSYVSPSIEKLRGYSVDEIMAQPVDYVFRPDDVTRINQLLRDRLNDYLNGIVPLDRVYIDEIDQHCKDDSYILTEITTNFQKNPTTGRIEIFGVTRDITDRRKMEIALKEENDLLEAVFNSVPGILFLYDADGNLLRWNSRHEEVTGYSAEELDHFNLYNWFDGKEEDKIRVEDWVVKVLETGFAVTEAEISTKTGEQILFEFTASRLEINRKAFFTGIGIDIRNRRQAEIKIMATTADLEKKKAEAAENNKKLLSMIEEQKKAEEALQHEQYLMRTLMDTIPDTIWFKDKESRFLRVNEAQAKRLGAMSPSDLLGKTDFDFFPQEHAKFAFEQEQEIIKKGQSIINDDEMIVFSDRPPEWFSVSKLPLYDQSGKIVGTYGLARDITERKRAEEELQTAYDATLEGWAAALELREKETANHSRNVVEMTVRIAEHFQVSEEEIIHIRRGALLHDIGKMGIPDSILLKPGPLSSDEWNVMKMHPVFAWRLLSGIPYLEPALAIPYSHHERWDGTGYPQGLKGTEIPLSARIFAVVDVWDALSSDRPYRPAWTYDTVIQYIKDQSGVFFDPDVVQVFLEIINRTGS